MKPSPRKPSLLLSSLLLLETNRVRFFEDNSIIFYSSSRIRFSLLKACCYRSFDRSQSGTCRSI